MIDPAYWDWLRRVAVFILLVGPVIAVVGYVVVRVWLIAYFRTRLEYLRAKVRELRNNGGPYNG